MRESNLPFDEVRIPMFTGTWESELASYSPAGRVPVLIDGEISVWDSLAIIQYLQENSSETVGWPQDQDVRAHARSIAAEMHSGFIAVRAELPQNIRRRNRLQDSQLTPGCRAQIARIIEIWVDCRTRYGSEGDWLFGDFSVADVMFAPVALRFQTYGVGVPAPASDFMQAVLGLPSIREWSDAASDEIERIDFIDNLVPASDSPLTLG